jgi:hypothetical protein
MAGPVITYSQVSGGISIDDEFIGTGYSGHGDGVDNPALEAVRTIGPIPKGQYRILRWQDHYPKRGPIVAVLAPNKHDAHGRSGFLIHGDNAKMNKTGSWGCIVASRDIRIKLRDSGETLLEVI